MFSAPNQQETVVEQVQKNIAAIQQQATQAVGDLNAKVLAATGAKNNEQLLSTVQTQAQSYAAQVKTVTDQINQKVAEQKGAVDTMFSQIVKNLADSAANLLGQQDPAKVEQFQGTFNNVLTQTNALQGELAKQGAAAQQTFAETLSKLYEQTLTSAKSFATQLDASANRPQ